MSYKQHSQLCTAPNANHGQGNIVLSTESINSSSLTHNVGYSGVGYLNIHAAYKTIQVK